MTIHAYHEIYVNKVQTRLGIAFDYAINVCLIPGEEFTELFCRSQVCRSLERGESRYALGKSGIEILVDVIEETTGRAPEIKPECRFFRTKEHWIGWTAAYCQWYTDRSFRELFTSIPYSDFEKMYTTLHEADISKFMDIAEEWFRETFRETELKRARMCINITQEELSNRSGVSLRSIQMYEERNRNINKASFDTLYRLSKAMYCHPEDLRERWPYDSDS